MTSDLDRICAEQLHCSDQLRAGNPQRSGLMMAISDWIAEEAILRGFQRGDAEGAD